MPLRSRPLWFACALLALVSRNASAEPSTPLTLQQAFHAAWQRQPEALSQQARQDAATAQQRAATAWTAEPVALELSAKTDRLNQNLGREETVAGLSVALWLPGERSRTEALADAQARAATNRVRTAQLRTAANVREAYWAWQRMRIAHSMAREFLGHVQQLARDVTQRVQAGDLARADQHQADSAVASAQAALAEATATLTNSTQRLRALTGMNPPDTEATSFSAIEAVAAPLPPASWDAFIVDHPAVAELQDRVAVALRAAELAQVQTRSNPELTLATTRDRGQRDEAYQHGITLGIRIPLGSDSRTQAKRASAQAEAIEAQAQLHIERERLQSEIATAHSGLASARTQLQAAQQHAQLARESRAFFQKSYRMGETDVPTRLRVEREAVDAEHQAARAQVNLAAAWSTWHQTVGLLPQ
jgi:outer membrane protein, heavy metal efflux system